MRAGRVSASFSSSCRKTVVQLLIHRKGERFTKSFRIDENPSDERDGIGCQVKSL
jgi:hypothetical protein